MATRAQSVTERGGKAAASASGALNAPLFQSLIERLRGAGRCVVLDLGAARPETIRLLCEFRCRLDIVDLTDGLDQLNSEQTPRGLRDRAESLLPSRRRESTDVVLCWDMLNYLNRPALSMLMECVAARGRRGTLAHALVVYSARKMPVRPSTFYPIDEQHLASLAPAQSERDAPRYTPEDFALCMPRYTVERARLLRNGMQEFLFRL
ncbi:MAG TPA: hypothetical protein VE907_22845 [Gammaproteobacteria bacterium]|nr:hypothetical protein [Gammaproteobacteria bacterium]